ncbi:hypothetical protein CRM22_008093 [Opisthorchis felineus]|uniref:Uncharacterized protein n=2 Tax=Opisthorchis felineus TaxID=147828 RepID=A0A4S2LKR1_OPIFE|nr:hypothetical protein CRM22_008093 [Opisthorchis felineus]
MNYHEQNVDDEGPWNRVKLFLCGSCFLNFALFCKLPIDFYLGSGWSLVCYFLFLFIFAGPTFYIQFLEGTQLHCGLVRIFRCYTPWSNVGAVGYVFVNLIQSVLDSVHLTYCISYILFALYHCDGRQCVSSSYMWSSCNDVWAEGDCREGYELVYSGPLAEEKFLLNYVLMRTSSAVPLYGFPSWFQLSGLVLCPYFVAWLLICLLVLFGRKGFGLMLYILSPLTIFLLLGVVIQVGAEYADSRGQLGGFISQFFANFATLIPVQQYARDKFEIKPLIWGLLMTFVHLSRVANLWTGVLPMLGKFANGDGKRKHISWIPVFLGFVLLSPLPVLLVVFATASSYDPEYLRCHLGTDWMAPFVIVPHVLSKFSSHRTLAVSYFCLLLLCILLSTSLRLLATVDNIVDMFMAADSLRRQRRKVHYTTVLIVVLFLSVLGIPMICRSGFFWMRLVDAYAERLLVVLATIQAVGFLVVYARTEASGYGQKVRLLIVNVVYGLLFSLATIVYAWYAVIATRTPTDSQCHTYSQAPKDDPLTNNFQYLGWSIAVSPIALGMLYTIATVFKRSQKENRKFCEVLCNGDPRRNERRYVERPAYCSVAQGDGLHDIAYQWSE